MFQIYFMHAIFIKLSFNAVLGFERNNSKSFLACPKFYRDLLSQPRAPSVDGTVGMPNTLALFSSLSNALLRSYI